MNQQSINNSQNNRPGLLSFLCTLSFIGSGITAISNLFIYFNHAIVVEVMQEFDWEAFEMNPSFFLDVKKNYFLFAGLLNVISFTGVRQMWFMRKVGFHLYVLSQLLILIVSTIYVYRPAGFFPVYEVLVVLIFILWYYRFQGKMH